MSFSLIVKRESIMPDIMSKAGGVWKGDFSFKRFNGGSNKTERSIFPFSDSLKTFITDDGAFKSLKLDNYQKFLDAIPSIKFRAYFPNTALNEIFSFMGKMGFSTEALKNFEWSTIEKFFGEASNIVKGLARPDASKNLAHNIAGDLGPFNDEDAAIYNLPFALYYKLVSSTNSAVYEVPCNIPSGFFDVNGNYGWGTGDDVDIFNAGGFLKRIAGMFHFTMMPFFTPGNGGEGESMNVKFDLINDTEASARANFTFVQTLMLNNKWLQYGVSQVPGCVYDVKIAGGQRFFMCTGDFKITNKGVLRSVGELGFGIGLGPYGTETKIPDVYSLDLTFKSLLPNNLNNYLFGIANESMKDVSLDDKTLTTSVFSEVAEKLVDALKGIGEGYANDVKGAAKFADTTSSENKQVAEEISQFGSDDAKKTLNTTQQNAQEAAVRAMDAEKNNPETKAAMEKAAKNAEEELKKDNPSATTEQIQAVKDKAAKETLDNRVNAAGQKAYDETFNNSIQNSQAFKAAIQQSHEKK